MRTKLPEARLLTPVCELDDLPIGLGRSFRAGNQVFALFRTRAGKVLATEANCPHKGASLANGMLAGEQIVCPLHAFRFDGRTGECDQEGVCRVDTYPVEIRDGRVFVAFGSAVEDSR